MREHVKDAKYECKLHDNAIMVYCVYCMECHFVEINNINGATTLATCAWMVRHWQHATGNWNNVRLTPMNGDSNAVGTTVRCLCGRRHP